MINLVHMERGSGTLERMAERIKQGHYLHKMPSPITSYEVYGIWGALGLMGALVFGRPQATKCQDWYGGLEGVKAGLCEVTRWQVLNLARVWIEAEYQSGGVFCDPDIVPGFRDRKGVWRSSLASTALNLSVKKIGYEYLRVRPPVFLDEPYEIAWVMSYCDSKIHRGTIYREAGWELYRTNEEGVQTWRVRAPKMSEQDNWVVAEMAMRSPRSERKRAERAQMEWGL